MELMEVLYEKGDGIATIINNRPRTLNAFTRLMGEDWISCLRDAQADPGVKVVILTGAGRAFCAGGNPKALLTIRPSQRQKLGPDFVPDMPDMLGTARAILALKKPLIAAINGPCIGGAMDLVSLCDIRIASDKARFSMAFIRMGESPILIGCHLFPRLVGLPQALELMWTARMFDAQEALHMGYVNRVVPHEELMPVTRELALQIARGPTVAINIIKELTHRCLTLNLEQAVEAHAQASEIACASEDAIEGPLAWIEKREPMFKGR